jgi:hypothetical protein
VEEEFFIELPRDEYGKRMYTNSQPRVIKAVRINQYQMKVLEPGLDEFPWPTLSPRGWISCQGPARLVTKEERDQIIAQRI